MRRTCVLLILACVPTGCCGGGDKQAAQLANEAAAVRIRELIPEASSSPIEDWQALSRAGAERRIEKMQNQSLSMVLMTLPGSAEHGETFEPETVDPGKLVSAVEKSKAKGYGTLIQPEFITECKCTVKDAHEATGTVAFRANGLYRGRVEFTARRDGGDWRVEEFHLPGYDVRVTLQRDGKWKMTRP